ncbi:hypothetical protein ZWY2020_050720 [Hordeum vulgare]|nr:hypothetical protein ZWY2020_050720 [Hordeum vulgare]
MSPASSASSARSAQREGNGEVGVTEEGGGAPSASVAPAETAARPAGGVATAAGGEGGGGMPSGLLPICDGDGAKELDLLNPLAQHREFRTGGGELLFSVGELDLLSSSSF